VMPAAWSARRESKSTKTKEAALRLRGRPFRLRRSQITDRARAKMITFGSEARQAHARSRRAVPSPRRCARETARARWTAGHAYCTTWRRTRHFLHHRSLAARDSDRATPRIDRETAAW